MTLFFAVRDCALGRILIAQSQLGVCAILFGDNPQTLMLDLQNQFPQAELRLAREEHEEVIAQVISSIEDPSLKLTIPLDIQGTDFQKQVWTAIQNIPPGQTVSYNDLAKQIHSPLAVRAVANACAANKLAALIPCHRVVRNDGSLAGYRWGIERKKLLLQKEQRP